MVFNESFQSIIIKISTHTTCMTGSVECSTCNNKNKIPTTLIVTLTDSLNVYVLSITRFLLPIPRVQKTEVPG